ncbi:MAG: hypothetical protein IJ272_07685 [Clostridia bacterium]|nr:hypothetical protein [Clostridia bacterium]
MNKLLQMSLIIIGMIILYTIKKKVIEPNKNKKIVQIISILIYVLMIVLLLYTFSAIMYF